MAAYIIAEIDVTDAEAYKAYSAQTPGLIARFGGKFIVRGGVCEGVEGAPPAGRIVVIEFADMAAAKRFYAAPDYQEILPLRTRNATSRMMIVEGVA